MSDNTEQPGGGAAPRDPWAAPDSRVSLGKPGGGTGQASGEPRRPAVHDQPTVTSMPGAGPEQAQSPTAPVPPHFGSAHDPIPGAGQAPGANPWQQPGAAQSGTFTGAVDGSPPGAGAGANPWQYPGSTSDASGAMPGYVPPPPTAPNGLGPTAPPGGQYGYPAAPASTYGYPGYPGYGQNQWGPAPANGMGTAALVLGIISVVGFCLWGLGIVLGVLALVFGLLGRGRAKRGEANNGGMAIAGVVLGAVGIAVSATFLGFMIWAISQGESFEDEDTYPYDDSYATTLVIDAPR
ncbi:DUF4190 domain-containing protein [Streptomyces sp. AM 4-1-1]|uniref:DUF4190 domain-containing protein n=1 Tax=Streptomyces sp. AM 4-1-1 TaxID=3028710 RepID=UPI0023B9C88B|nr:DUF4190 domain-containing protein [Streptomyces sp. AM 4-1-1]WEH36148.1 DUF4190 domain-containing protein [Streptomyces sp. AM 4-1-1]